MKEKSVMNLKKISVTVSYLFIVFAITGALGCATRGGVKNESAEQFPRIEPLEKRYSEIVVYEIETTPQLKHDYEQELKDCKSTLILSLAKSNKYKTITDANGKEVPGGTALIIKIKVTDMRIAGFSGRFWGGALAGSSYMYMQMKLVDAETGNSVRDEVFNSTNNAFAAAWNFGASDRSLPTDMSEIIADYIVRAVNS